MKSYFLLSIFIRLMLLSSSQIAQINQQENAQPITLAQFKKLTCDKNRIILVYCHASWCAVCAKMKPVIQKLDSLYHPHLEILNIDTDRDKEIAEEFEINSLPVFMLYKHGNLEWTRIGILSEKEFVDNLNKFVLPE